MTQMNAKHPVVLGSLNKRYRGSLGDAMFSNSDRTQKIRIPRKQVVRFNNASKTPKNFNKRENVPLEDVVRNSPRVLNK